MTKRERMRRKEGKEAAWVSQNKATVGRNGKELTRKERKRKEREGESELN